MHTRLTPSFGMNPFELHNEPELQKIAFELSVSETIVILALFVLLQYQSVTD